MKIIKTRILNALCIAVFILQFQIARADDTSATGAPNRNSSSSPSYDESMKWIQSKLETWTTGILAISTNATTGVPNYQWRKSAITAFDNYGNIHIEEKDPSGITSTVNFTIDLSLVTNITVVYVEPTTYPIPPDLRAAAGGATQSYFPGYYRLDLLPNGAFTFPHKDEADRMAKAFRHAVDLVRTNGPF